MNGGHRPINWVENFENEIDKTKKLVVNKVQLYPLSSLFFNFFYEETNKEKERKKAGGPYFQQVKGLLQMHRIVVSL